MLENSYSSKRKCHCGEFANRFTSTTLFNPGRRFYKCPKPQDASCGYWEWSDDPIPDRALVVINNLRSQLDAANVKISNLKSSLDNVNIESDKLKEKLIAVKARNHVQVTKLEENILKMKIFTIILCTLLVGIVAARVMN
ncbi:PREDICTED: uncharacterized protein At4g04775-like [Nicotiana attenuata]|uniref:uncharacterized protein At4g04775-like n=1 Tax=Nicotiana attenuata TaxID=49451 RepID=UPI00090511FD|nr:PREDICTED: uncharacterized protein At4g04775-like [Nicotiana attenuata]